MGRLGRTCFGVAVGERRPYCLLNELGDPNENVPWSTATTELAHWQEIRSKEATKQSSVQNQRRRSASWGNGIRWKTTKGETTEPQRHNRDEAGRNLVTESQRERTKPSESGLANSRHFEYHIWEVLLSYFIQELGNLFWMMPLMRFSMSFIFKE